MAEAEGRVRQGRAQRTAVEPPPSARTYLLFGRGANTGDLGIAAAMLQEIRRVDPGASFVYFCDRPEAYAALPELEGHEVEPFRDISSGWGTRHLARISPTLAFCVRLLLLRWWPGLLCRFEPKLRRIVERHAAADLVVRQGGPGWNDWVLNARILRIRLAYLALARRNRLPMVMFGQSFGPFTWAGSERIWKKYLVRFLLNRARLLTLRDAHSAPALERLGVHRPAIVQAADVAWILDPAPVEAGWRCFDRHGISAQPRPWVGLTLRSLHGRYGVSEEREQELIGEFARFCEHITERAGTLIFLSTDYRQHGRRNDLEMVRLVQRRMRDPSAIRVFDEEAGPGLLKAMYGLMDALVTVRLHPGIFAMAAGVPTLLIGYDPKCADVAAQMEGGALHTDIRGFTAERGIELFDHLMRHREVIASETSARAGALQERARLSADGLEGLIRTLGRTPR